jgi:hypothetical protein
MEVIMGRYLVVAHETVSNPVLLKQLGQITASDQQAEFVLLVPATRVRHLLFRRSTDQDAGAAANELAEKARKLFENKVNLIDTRVGAESPVTAIDDEVKAHPGYTGFVISTLPEETSRWLKMDLPEVVRAKYGLPVRHVQAPPDWFGPYRAWWTGT